MLNSNSYELINYKLFQDRMGLYVTQKNLELSKESLPVSKNTTVHSRVYYISGTHGHNSVAANNIYL